MKHIQKICTCPSLEFGPPESGLRQPRSPRLKNVEWSSIGCGAIGNTCFFGLNLWCSWKNRRAMRCDLNTLPSQRNTSMWPKSVLKTRRVPLLVLARSGKPMCWLDIRRKFRSQNSDNMDRWKAEMGRVREKRRVEERRSEKRKSQKKEDAGARKGRKVAKHCVFPMICGSGGSKSRLAKAAGAEPAGQMRDEKLHAVVARSTFRSQNVQNTSASDHFWKLRCRKSARCCGAKHISKSKCTKHTSSGPLLEVEMSKKCTHVVARSTFRSQNVQNTSVSDHFWKLRFRKSAPSQKRSKTWGLQHVQKRWHASATFEEDLQRCIFRGRHSTRDIFIRAVSLRSSRLLRWFCVTGAALRMSKTWGSAWKRWQAWDIWRGSAKMHFPWQAQYKRHLHQSC